MEQQHRDVWEAAPGGGVRDADVRGEDVRGDGTRGDGVRDGSVRRAAGGRGFGGAGLVAAVAAGCAVTVLASDPSWALRRPEPRPAVEVLATGTPSTLPAPVTPGASTLPAPATPGASTLPALVIPGASTLPAPVTPGASTLPAPATPGASTLPALVIPGAKPGAGSGSDAGSDAGSGTSEASTLPAPAVARRPSASDLEVVRSDPDTATPGGTTTVRAFVGNGGPETTASPFTVLVSLPEGVSPEGPFFPSDCQVTGHGRVVRCVFGPGLREGRSATALIPVRLDPELPAGRLSGGSVTVRSADDRNEGNNRQPFDITVVETAAGS
ncbi:hypothetical protein ACGF0D_31825 [Kitasatospora sp. NPDC048298]|uniref:hypothetical protein n=1 Tax=Kitasatospora sp. NPDC048298 TaxID=3364049 RepID=UPI00371DF436